MVYTELAPRRQLFHGVPAIQQPNSAVSTPLPWVKHTHTHARTHTRTLARTHARTHTHTHTKKQTNNKTTTTKQTQKTNFGDYFVGSRYYETIPVKPIKNSVLVARNTLTCHTRNTPRARVWQSVC